MKKETNIKVKISKSGDITIKNYRLDITIKNYPKDDLTIMMATSFIYELTDIININKYSINEVVKETQKWYDEGKWKLKEHKQYKYLLENTNGAEMTIAVSIIF